MWRAAVATGAHVLPMCSVWVSEWANSAGYSQPAAKGHTMTPRPLTRYVLHLRCPACGAGDYAAGPLLVPLCPLCAGGRLRPCGVWDLVTAAHQVPLRREETRT